MNEVLEQRSFRGKHEKPEKYLEKMMRTLIAFLAAVILAGGSGNALLHAQKTEYPDIPRIDIHSHIRDNKILDDYLNMADMIKNDYGADLVLWVNLSTSLKPGRQGLEEMERVEKEYQGRFLHTINDYRIADGLAYSPEELAWWHNNKVAGFKIWVGVSPLSDHPANDPVYTKMEQLGMVAASVHISQPYPTSWCESPVDFWGAQLAWLRVLDRHPDLVVVMAHMQDFFNSDEQLDFLRYMMEAYPNYHVDLAARFQQFSRMDRDNLREFMIQYQDRILFGTDISDQPSKDPESAAAGYNRCFRLLETAEVVEGGGFFSDRSAEGLDLPREVLEKIYYRNAAKIYPRVSEALEGLGYDPGTDHEGKEDPHAGEDTSSWLPDSE